MRDIKKTLHLYLNPTLYRICEWLKVVKKDIKYISKRPNDPTTYIFVKEWGDGNKAIAEGNYYCRILPKGIDLFELI